MARWPWVVAWLLVGCSATTTGGDRQIPTPTTPASTEPRAATVPVRLLVVGDVMLGRSVAPVVANDPGSVFESLRAVVTDSDLAVANLESPLTERPHLVGPYALEADPGAAALLAGAGFDVLGIANNHATDAGPDTVLDTIDALTSAGLQAVGGGADESAAAEPVVIDLGGMRIGIVAFDLAGGTPATSTTAGVNTWSSERAEAIVTGLRREVDVVIVGLHGGVEYLPRPDPVLQRVVGQLETWGADVVWGHGAHVAYPVTSSPSNEGRGTVSAPGLGNALFDQRLAGTDTGTVLEVLLDADRGAVAFRTGTVRSESGRTSFTGWDVATGDAVWLDGTWWSPVGEFDFGVPPDAGQPTGLPVSFDVTAFGVGDVTGTGALDTVIAYRRPFEPEALHAAFPGTDWTDADGRAAHLAVFRGDGAMRWGAATMLQPVGTLAVCDGSVALGFTTLDDVTVVGGGAWAWEGFGFSTAPVLAGAVEVGCVDLDGDGATEPAIKRPSHSMNEEGSGT